MFTVLFHTLFLSQRITYTLNLPSLPLYLLDHTGPKNRVLGFLGRRTRGLDDPACCSASPSGRRTPVLDDSMGSTCCSRRPPSLVQEVTDQANEMEGLGRWAMVQHARIWQRVLLLWKGGRSGRIWQGS